MSCVMRLVNVTQQPLLHFPLASSLLTVENGPPRISSRSEGQLCRGRRGSRFHATLHVMYPSRLTPALGGPARIPSRGEGQLSRGDPGSRFYASRLTLNAC